MLYTLRLSREGDEPKLKEIWKICFQDTDDYINLFFEKMYSVGCAVVAEAETKAEICSCMYVLDAGNMPLPNGEKARCCYLYALGTMPEYRGMGLGGKVSKGAAQLGFDMGYDICITCPADDGLFEYYRKLGFLDFSSVSKVTCEVHGEKSGQVKKSSLENYLGQREMLAPKDAIEYSRSFMEFLKESLEMFGGGLFTVDDEEDKCSVAAIEVPGADCVIIKELLNGDTQRAIECVGHYFGKKKAHIVTPPLQGALPQINTLAVYRDDRIQRLIKSAYFPFTLD